MPARLIFQLREYRQGSRLREIPERVADRHESWSNTHPWIGPRMELGENDLLLGLSPTAFVVCFCGTCGVASEGAGIENASRTNLDLFDMIHSSSSSGRSISLRRERATSPQFFHALLRRENDSAGGFSKS